MSYSKLTILIFVLIRLVASNTIYATEFVFNVKQDQWLGGKGTLVISTDGIEFRAEKANDTRWWTYPDVRGIDIISPHKLIIRTYEDLKWKLGGGRRFSFQVVKGEISEEVYKFLLGKIDKPIVTRTPFPSADPVHKLLVKHRHRLGGCQGVLKISEDRVVYDSERSKDRRIWLYRDIESIGTSNPFHLRITTYTETYTFELKEKMSGETYSYLWERVYRVRIEP